MSRTRRHEQVAALLERRGLDAVLLRTPANFAWYTGGADNRVNLADPAGVAGVLLTAEDEWVVTTNIEAQRLRDEQAPDMEVLAYPWHEELAGAVRRQIGTGARLGLDSAADASSGAWAPTESIATDLAPLRWVLDAEAIARYRAVGADAMAALVEAVAELSVGVAERFVAARVADACQRRGLHTPVVLVAGDERIARYRHPIVSDAVCRRRVMVVLCAERGGLVANLTRFVWFEDPEPTKQRQQAVCETLLRRMRVEATLAGTTLAEAFAACQRFYAEAGQPMEWQQHHQGGLTGYASRELIATPRTAQVIQVGQAFAWNPSLPGAKAEETFVLTADGPEIIAGFDNQF